MAVCWCCLIDCFALFVSLSLVVGLECFYCLFEWLLLGVSV